jgi:hypothetical protein
MNGVTFPVCILCQQPIGDGDAAAGHTKCVWHRNASRMRHPSAHTVIRPTATRP